MSDTLGAWLGCGAHVVVAMMAMLLGGLVRGCGPWLTHVVRQMRRGMWVLPGVGLDDGMAKGWGRCVLVVVSIGGLCGRLCVCACGARSAGCLCKCCGT